MPYSAKWSNHSFESQEALFVQFSSLISGKINYTVYQPNNKSNQVLFPKHKIKSSCFAICSLNVCFHLIQHIRGSDESEVSVGYWLCPCVLHGPVSLPPLLFSPHSSPQNSIFHVQEGIPAFCLAAADEARHYVRRSGWARQLALITMSQRGSRRCRQAAKPTYTRLQQMKLSACHVSRRRVSESITLGSCSTSGKHFS